MKTLSKPKSNKVATGKKKAVSKKKISSGNKALDNAIKLALKSKKDS